MMNTKALGVSAYCALLLSGFVLSACDQSVDIQNGLLPDNMVPYAQKMTGDYNGQFTHEKNTLTVKLDGNRLELIPASDLIGSACNSHVGDLTRISYSVDDNNHVVQITAADFGFNAGLCPDIIGKTLELSGKTLPDGSIQLDAQLLKDFVTYSVWVPGQVVCSVDAHGHQHCWQTPGHYETHEDPEYLFGVFVRK